MEKPLLQDLLDFFKKPVLEKLYLGKLKKLSLTLQIWSLQTIFIFIAGIITTFVISKTSWSGENIVNIMAQNSIFYFFLMAVIVAPVLEEFAFRGWLNPKLKVFVSSLAILSFFLTQITLNYLYLDGFWLLFSLFFSLFLGFSLYFYLSRNQDKFVKIKEFFKTNFFIIFYFSALFFGLVHLSNFINLKEVWFLFPVLVLPQIIGGLTLGYLRVRLGLVYAIISHTLTNLIPFSLIFLIHQLSEPLKTAFFEDKTQEINFEKLSNFDNFILGIMGAGFLLLSLIVIFIFIKLLADLAVSKKLKKN